MPQDTPRTPPAADSPMRVSVVPATNRHFITRLDELIDIHLAAMNYPNETHAQRKSCLLYTSDAADE